MSLSAGTDERTDGTLDIMAEVLRDPLFRQASRLAKQDAVAIDRWIVSLTPDEDEHVLALLRKVGTVFGDLFLGVPLDGTR